MLTIPRKYIYGIAAVVFVLAAGIVYYGYWSGLQREAVYELARSEPAATSSEPAEPLAPAEVKVYLSGAVANPGVYTVQSGGRIIDVLEMAGGALGDADLERVNLAAYVSDAQQIQIPREGEELPPEASGAASAAAKLININMATAAELQALPGFGPVMSERVVDYREKNGAFEKIEDIKRVSGVGDKRFEQIEGLIAVK